MTKDQERRAVWQKFDGRCAYCGKPLKYKDMQVDHMEPKASRRPIGRDLLGNLVYPDLERYQNKMPSCRRCNHYKRARSLKEFRYMIKTIHNRIRDFYIVKVGEDYDIIEYHPWDGQFYFEKQQSNKQF